MLDLFHGETWQDPPAALWGRGDVPVALRIICNMQIMSA